jgi:DNA-binding NtrC family response regulator
VKPEVLVVDDEPSIAEALRLILERDGYVVETAGNIAEASARTDGRDFAVALVDLVLPDGDGLSLLKILKGRDPDIEVIIMTGHGSISKAVEATKEGAFYFVTKPFDSAEMLTLLGKALERRHLLAETSDLRRQLAEQLASRITVPVFLVDERLTTVTAAAQLRASGRNSKSSRAVIDQAAATTLLQAVLDAAASSGCTVADVLDQRMGERVMGVSS